MFVGEGEGEAVGVQVDEQRRRAVGALARVEVRLDASLDARAAHERLQEARGAAVGLARVEAHRELGDAQPLAEQRSDPPAR